MVPCVHLVHTHCQLALFVRNQSQQRRVIVVVVDDRSFGTAAALNRRTGCLVMKVQKVVAAIAGAKVIHHRGAKSVEDVVKNLWGQTVPSIVHGIDEGVDDPFPSGELGDDIGVESNADDSFIVLRAGVPHRDGARELHVLSSRIKAAENAKVKGISFWRIRWLRNELHRDVRVYVVFLGISLLERLD